jgi:stearoyl-CoA desaturase (delta-9 desaturase)
MRCIPFIGMHVAAVSVLWVGFSWVALAVAAVVFGARVFGLTAFYHRYFSHRAFRTTRWFQFVGAILGNAAAQRGPLWWCAHHRAHHQHSDEPEDRHSPRQHGFWWSHMGWFMTRENYATDTRVIRDWLRFPELRLLDRFDFVVPLVLAAVMFGLGALLAALAPGLGTSGVQMLVWGFLLSTLFLYHVTYSVNSVAHVFGSRRFATKDDSRNNLWVALFTFGEGWHNNHHRYPPSARQGFVWWEVDITFYILLLLEKMGFVWGLKTVPAYVLAEAKQGAGSRVVDRGTEQRPSLVKASLGGEET